MGTGPQHREFQQEIQQTMKVEGRGPDIENFNKKFYRQCKLGTGPQHREFQKEILQTMQVGVTTIKQYFFFRN
ncbi:hypothetical protein AXJ26_03075 [Staphylococcus argenteus]|nr:hypothetical protein AXJ26_03075 [Staphylococcus argenteus]OMH91077.1 hypothetical protein A4R30_02000 [Staphylococcus argenteus]OMH92931.1 hypothetical protein A4R31_02780 [Staphylococcus argenteus]OMI01901.1 hypothetical protein A4R33_06085 [Staphylococcus argenteus]PSJ11122.1 nitrogen fixation protein NifR [Staphylococcus argenteus]